MVNQIEWSPEAEDSFDSILEYINEQFGPAEVGKFVDRVDSKLKLLVQFPGLGNPSNKRKKTHVTLVHKKITLVYQVNTRKNVILLVTFWNNQQNPGRFKY